MWRDDGELFALMRAQTHCLAATEPEGHSGLSRNAVPLHKAGHTLAHAALYRRRTD